MGYSVDGSTEGPSLPQSVWRYRWLVGGLVLLGILGAALFSATQPTLYEGVVRIFVTAEEGAAGEPERTVISHAQFIESRTVSDRVIALTGNRLTGKELEERLKVEPSPDGDFITIRARDTTSTNAAALADAVDLAYRQILSEQRQTAANQTIEALQGVQARLASELTRIRRQRRTDASPALQAEEQAKIRELEATANKIEETSSDAAGFPPGLQDKAAVPDEPVQPKPLLALAIGAVVGLVIGVALAWLLAARRRAKPGEDSAESQAHIDDGRHEPVEVGHDRVEHPRTEGATARAASGVGATASEIQDSAEQVRVAEDQDERVTGAVGQTVNSLDKDPDLLYSLSEWLESQHQNYPQVTAERLRDRLLFERVAVLLKTDEGLDLAGCVGWQPNGVGSVGHRDPSILNMLRGSGARQVGSEERDELLNGLLGDEIQTVIVAPLEHENVAFGMLLVGQEESDSQAPQQMNGSFDRLGSFARSVAPDLHAWLLLHKLREQLASYGKAQVQTTSPAGSKPAAGEPSAKAPSAKSEPPAVEPEPAAEPDPPAAEPETPSPKSEPPPSAESEPPSAESEPSSAGSEPPPTADSKPPPPTAESGPPPTAESGAPPTAESEPPSAWPVYPAESEPPAAESESPVGEPSAKAPSAKAPSAKAPSANAPSTKAPSAKAPSTKAPSAKAPSTKAPSTKSAPPSTPHRQPASSVDQQNEHQIARG